MGHKITTAAVVNADKAQQSILSGLLRKEGLETVVFEKAEAALKGMARNSPPALIVTDIYMPGIDGWRFCRLLRSQEFAEFNQVPILMASASPQSEMVFCIAADLGIGTFQAPPVEGQHFSENVRALLRGDYRRNAPRVIIVEDSPALADFLKQTFADSGYEADVAITGAAAVERFQASVYEAAIVDYHLPDTKGDALLSAFHTTRPECVCIMMTSDPSMDLALQWMNQGAAAYVRKPFNPQYLVQLCAKARQEQSLLRTVAVLEQQALHSQLHEQRYHTVMSGIEDGYFEVDVKGNYTYCNAAFGRIIGFSGESLIGRNFRSCMAAQTISQLKEVYQRLFRTGQAIKSYLYERVDHEGNVKHIDSSVSLIHDAEGNITGFRGVVRDVTTSKRSEQALRALAESAVETGEDIFRLLVRHLALSQSARYTLLARIAPGDPQTAHTLAVWSGDNYADNFSYALEDTPCREVTTQGACFYPRDIQKLFPRDPILGQMNAQSYWGTPLKDSTGRVMGILALLDDRAMQKHPETLALLNTFAARAASELERKQAEAEHERLMSAIEQSGEMVVIVNHEGAMLFVNQAFTNITGYARSEALGMNPRLLKSGHHDQAFYKELWETILSGRRWTGRLINRRKDGTRYTADCAISPVKGADGAAAHFIWIARDITEQMELERRLVMAQKMETIGTLSAGIAHDFNNILFPIMGCSEMLMDDLVTGSPAHEQATEIYEAALRAGELVNQILSFSRKTAHERVPVRIQRILKEAIRMSRAMIPTSIQITYSIPDDCGMILADSTHLHQIVMNMIINAYHAVEDSLGKIVITLTTVPSADFSGTLPAPNGYALLAIADTGHGIPAEVMGKIFDPYFTTKKQGKGTGLGLAVVFGIVKEYGGDIQVASEVGKGTTFKVYLPLLQNAQEEILPVKKRPPVIGTERILLIDDEAAIVRLVKQMLERFGYQVEGKDSSVEALALFKKDPTAFDLVITDMTMPQMSGDRLARALMAIRPELPVILCTGLSETIDAQRGTSQDNISGYLKKPVVMSDLAIMVRDILDKAKKK